MSDEHTTTSPPRHPGGVERRRRQRTSGTLATVIGRARLIPRMSGHYPSLRPGGWYQVIARNPASLEPVAREGFLWIDVDGRPRHVWAGQFEIQAIGE